MIPNARDVFHSLVQVAEAEADIAYAASTGFPGMAAAVAAASALSNDDLDHLTGAVLLLAYLRHRRAGGAIDRHEMRHLEAAWLAGNSDGCLAPDACRVRIAQDGAVALAPDGDPSQP